MYRNTESSYGLVAIVLHWLMALSIFFMFGLGLYMVELSYYDAWYKGSLDLHKSLGILIILVFVFRLVWRLMNVEPEAFKNHGAFAKFERRAAKLAHWLLYVLMAVLMFSGYLISTADGRGIEVFSLFEVPALKPLIENQEDLAGEVHEWLAWGLIALVAVHALAALKHHFVDKDGTLKRMTRVSGSSQNNF